MGLYITSFKKKKVHSRPVWGNVSFSKAFKYYSIYKCGREGVWQDLDVNLLTS